jgi:hypothetical protein
MSEKDENGGGEDATAKAIAEATAGLKAKNDELLGKLKKEKAERDAMRETLDELKAAQEKADTEAAEKAGDWEKLKAQLESRQKAELEKLQGQLSAEQGINRRLLVDNGLTDALTAAGVGKDFLPAVRALIQSSNEIELTDVDGQRIAQVNGQPLKDFVGSWAQSDAGKHFVAAADNTGGGANGSGNGSPTGATITREAFDAMSHAQRAQALKDGKRPVN